MKLNKKVLAVIFSCLFFVGVANAQVADDPTLKACEQTADLLKKEQAKNAGLEIENKLLKEMSALKDDKIAFVIEQRDFYKKASENGTKIDTNATLIIQNLRDQVSDYKLELLDLRSENDKLRSSRTVRTLIGFGAGFGTGYLVKGNN